MIIFIEQLSNIMKLTCAVLAMVASLAILVPLTQGLPLEVEVESESLVDSLGQTKATLCRSCRQGLMSRSVTGLTNSWVVFMIV